MRKLITLFLVALCGHAMAQQVTYKGEEKELSFVAKDPKIAVFDLAASEAVHALEGRIVGASKAALPTQLSAIAEDPNIVDIGGLKNPDIQKVKQADPDLIIISGRQRSQLDSLSEIAPVLDVSPDNSDYFGSLYGNLKTLAQVLGKPAEGEALIQDLQKAVQAAQDRASQYNDSDALMLMFINGRYVGFPKQSRFGFIHDVLGFEESALKMDAAARSNRLTEEQILAANPGYIFIFDRTQLNTGILADKEKIETDILKQTDAYKNGRFVYLTPELWYLIGSGVYSTPAMADEALSPLQ